MTLDSITPAEERMIRLHRILKEAQRNVRRMVFSLNTYMENNYTMKQTLEGAIHTYLLKYTADFRALSLRDQKEVEEQFTEWFKKNWFIHIVLNQDRGIIF